MFTQFGLLSKDPSQGMLKVMSWRRLLTRRFLIGVFLLIALGVSFFLVLARGAKFTLIEQLLRRKQVIARAEASNIVFYFQVFGNSIAELAQTNSIRRRDEVATDRMDIFVEQQRESGLVNGIILTDSKGIVKFNSNFLGTRDLGSSVADRDYFLWAKDHPGEREYFIGRPVIGRIGVSKDRAIVPVAAPVYDSGVFIGALVSAVNLEALAERFLGKLKVSDATEVYLAGEQGDLFYSNTIPVELGSNIFELPQGNPFSDNKALRDQLKNALKTNEEGTFQTKTYSIAYSPILLVSQKWLLIIATPSQQLADLTSPFYIRQISMMLLTIFTSLLIGALVIKEIQIKRG